MDQEKYIESNQEFQKIKSFKIQTQEEKIINQNEINKNIKDLSSQNEQQYLLKKSLKKQKQKFIKKLIKSLGYQATLRIFDQECKKTSLNKNPEEESNKKRQFRNKKINLTDYQLRQLIQNSSNYDNMLDKLQNLYSLESDINQDSEQEDKQFIDSFESKIKQLSPIKRTALIPKYKNVEIIAEKTQIRLIDINENEQICLLDSDKNLHIISNRYDTRPFKIQQIKGSGYIKWINQNIIFLISYDGKLLVLEYDSGQVKLRTVFSLRLQKINLANIVIIKHQHNQYQIFPKILVTNQDKLVMISQYRVEDINYQFQKQLIFDSIEQLSELTVLKSFNKNIQNYYGLNKDKTIIYKFDVNVMKCGQFWRSKIYKIDTIINSYCNQFMLILLNKQNKKIKTKNNKSIINLYYYQIIKLNDKGYIIQKISLDFKNSLLSNVVAKNPTPIRISNMKLMDQSWFVCFNWLENIIYFSLITGKILYVQELQDKQIDILQTGKDNSIIYRVDGKIQLLSTTQREKKRIVLQKRTARDRQSLILRLTRNGIPQTLLQLLQELRNNQIQIIET